MTQGAIWIRLSIHRIRLKDLFDQISNLIGRY